MKPGNGEPGGMSLSTQLLRNLGRAEPASSEAIDGRRTHSLAPGSPEWRLTHVKGYPIIQLRAGQQSQSATDGDLRIPEGRLPLTGLCRAVHEREPLPLLVAAAGKDAAPRRDVA
jgi:hypothetical protein